MSRIFPSRPVEFLIITSAQLTFFIEYFMQRCYFYMYLWVLEVLDYCRWGRIFYYKMQCRDLIKPIVKSELTALSRFVITSWLSLTAQFCSTCFSQHFGSHRIKFFSSPPTLPLVQTLCGWDKIKAPKKNPIVLNFKKPKDICRIIVLGKFAIKITVDKLRI